MRVLRRQAYRSIVRCVTPHRDDANSARFAIRVVPQPWVRQLPSNLRVSVSKHTSAQKARCMKYRLDSQAGVYIYFAKNADRARLQPHPGTRLDVAVFVYSHPPTRRFGESSGNLDVYAPSRLMYPIMARGITKHAQLCNQAQVGSVLSCGRYAESQESQESWEIRTQDSRRPALPGLDLLCLAWRAFA